MVIDCLVVEEVFPAFSYGLGTLFPSHVRRDSEKAPA